MAVDLSELPAFAVACLVIALAPGVDAFLILRTTIRSGVRSGLLVLAGIYTASVLQVMVVVSGLGIFVDDHPAVLSTLRWLGAGYLCYLAGSIIYGLWRAYRSPDEYSTAEPDVGHDPRPYLRGLIGDLTNPKMLLFCLAVLPQFVGDAASPVLQLVLLGATFITITAAWESTLVLTASRVAGHLRRPRTMRALDAASAAVFLGLSAGLVVS